MSWANKMNTDDDKLGGKRSDWDIIKLGGVTFPGVAEVTLNTPTGLEVKKPRGGKRGTITDTGDPLVSFDISLILLPDDWDEFVKSALPLLKNRSKTKGRDPIQFVHPYATAAGVSNIVISNPKFAPPKGGIVKVTFKLVEWVKQPRDVKTSGVVSSQNFGVGKSVDPSKAGLVYNELTQSWYYPSDPNVDPYALDDSPISGEPEETVIDPYSSDDPNQF